MDFSKYNKNFAMKLGETVTSDTDVILEGFEYKHQKWNGGRIIYKKGDKILDDGFGKILSDDLISGKFNNKLSTLVKNPTMSDPDWAEIIEIFRSFAKLKKAAMIIANLSVFEGRFEKDLNLADELNEYIGRSVIPAVYEKLKSCTIK